MNLLFFASDFKIGLSALLTDQLISISQAYKGIVAVAGENEQENGLGKLVDEHKIDIVRIKGLDDHNDFHRLVRIISEIVINRRVNVIHVQNNWQLAIAYVVKCRLMFKRKVRIIYTIHGFRNHHPTKAKLAQAIIGSALFIAADRVICMTEYLKQKFKLLSYKVCILPLGVKDDFFTENFVPPEENTLRIIFPAQFRLGKNQDLIVRAFSKYVHNTDDKKAILILPGAGDRLEETKTLANELGIYGQVCFPGLLPKDEIRKLYLESNVAIVASNSETFGQSIVEPFVLGRCVVSSPVGIAPEIIRNGENGFIFSSESQLTEIFHRLATERGVLKQIGENNYALRDQFRWKNITDRYIKEFLS